MVGVVIASFSTMNDDAKIVIRGVLDKIDDENLTDDNATCIKQALDRLCGGTWNVILYPNCEVSTGSTSSCFYWRGKQWVYAEQTTNTSFNASEIKSFMDTEFGWSPIRDIQMVQQAANTKISNKFQGEWRVHVAQLKNGYSCSCCGIVWKADGYTFFIYRLA